MAFTFTYTTTPAYATQAPETFQSVFRATPISTRNVSNTSPGSEAVAVVGEPESHTVGETVKSVMGDAPLTFSSADTLLTFRAYNPKTSAVGRLSTHIPDLSVQVLKDVASRRDNSENMGLVGTSSYHVLPPTTTPPFGYQPHLQKKHRIQTTTSNGSMDRLEAVSSVETTSKPGDEMTEGGGPSTTMPSAEAPGANTPYEVHRPPSTSTLPTAPESTSYIPRKRARRTKPNPAPAPIPSLPPPYPPAIVPQYPYTPYSQYPYQYYVPAYNIPLYGAPPPHPFHHASSSSYPLPPTSAPAPITAPYSPHPPNYPTPYYLYHAYRCPPGCPYPPPRYVPGPYDQSYSQQPCTSRHMQQGTPVPYGYPNSVGYCHPSPCTLAPETQKTKRKGKRDEGQESSKTRAAPGVVALPVTLKTTSLIKSPLPEIATFVNDDKTITVNEPVDIIGKAEVSAQLSETQSRPCANKTCSRIIPNDVVGAICKRCRVRLKKHQAKAKQRFKLEPRKSILGVREARKVENVGAAEHNEDG